MLITLVLTPMYYYLGAFWTALAGVLMIAVILYVKKQNSYFSSKGINCLTSYIPILGVQAKVAFQREHILDFNNRLYKKFPEEKYFGFMNFTKPMLVVKDLEVIKLIGVKDFDHFMDHQRQINDSIDPIIGNTLLSLHGQKWRDMRATLSPAFTSSKMRGMFDFIAECGKQMAEFFVKETEKTENKGKKYIEVELKDSFSRYANDVIATSAFGLNVNSLQDRDNEFYLIGKDSTNFTGFRATKMLVLLLFPRIMKLFKISILSQKVITFFRDLVTNTMKMRVTQNIVRPDMIHLLMEAKKGSLKHETTKTESREAGFAAVEESDVGKGSNKRVWTDDELVAQAVLFFLAGFDTTSTALSFLAYELSKQPDIQKRLQEEIDEIAERNNGILKYDDLQQMNYMDMVVSELLRYWPPAIATDRKCIKPYTLPPSNDNSGGKLDVGDGIWIPIYSIHHDPQYYKNPEKFDPERFSDDNKHKINPLAYMPFGVGPRNCIGSRFALMEVKAVIFYLLLNFDFVVTEKTPIPFTMNNKAFNMMPKDGFWIGFSQRTSKSKTETK